MIDEVFKKLRGPKGSKVNLSIKRAGSDNLKKITLISRLLTVIALGMILQKNLIFLAQINYFSLEGPLLHQN